MPIAAVAGPQTREDRCMTAHRVSANVYPWDVDGDPGAADRIAGLGLDGVTLAAAYHAVRAVTPFHPRHRIVTREAAVYYRPGQVRWQGSPLAPVEADPPGSFERAAGRLRERGLRVAAWAVLTHGCRPDARPTLCVRNAYGDRYPWALCPGSAAVRDYATSLAAEVAALGEADEIELEACGWYGIDHGGAHDKTGGAAADPAARWLLSLCFCPACADGYARAGADPGELRAAVAAALDAALGWGPAGADSRLPGGADAPEGRPGGADDLLPDGMAAVLDATRADAASQLLHEVIAVVRAAAPGKPVLVHADPDPRAAGANPGYDPALLLGPGGADGIVLSCWDPAAAGPVVARTARAAPHGARIAASLLAVSGLGGRPATLTGQADTVLRAGATELRLYHAGLASAADLDAVQNLCRREG
jgi:hypothetical protein